jgi:hypothetical protein
LKTTDLSGTIVNTATTFAHEQLPHPRMAVLVRAASALAFAYGPCGAQRAKLFEDSPDPGEEAV